MVAGPTDIPSDADLVENARRGDGDAFGALWRRHAPSALAAARQFSGMAEPEDLVSEAYTRILAAVKEGKGPTGAFRPYLYVTIRNLATRIARSRREEAVDDLDVYEDPNAAPDPAIAALDRSLTARAFRSLPERWQTVLWYTAVEGLTPQEAAPLLGLSPNSTSALALRARAGLREAWLQAHIRDDSTSPECRWMLAHMGRYVRGELSTRDRARAERHLETCAKCQIVSEEIDDIGSRLAIVVFPLVLGATAGMGLLAALKGGAAASAVSAHGAAASSAAGAHGAAGSSAGAGASSSIAGATAVASTSTGWIVGASIAAAVIVAAGATWGGISLANHPSPSTTAADGPTHTAAPNDPASPDPDDPDPGASVAPPSPPETPADPPIARPPAVSVPTPPVTSDPPPVVDTPPPDTTPPDTTAAPPAAEVPDSTGASVPSVTGTAEPGATVSVTDQNGEVVATVVAADDGSFDTGPLTALSPATTSLNVTQTDVAGNVSDATVLGPFAFHPAFADAPGPLTTSASTMTGAPDGFSVSLLGWPGQAYHVEIRQDGTVLAFADGVFDDAGRATRFPSGFQPGNYVMTISYYAAPANTTAIDLIVE